MRDDLRARIEGCIERMDAKWRRIGFDYDTLTNEIIAFSNIALTEAIENQTQSNEKVAISNDKHSRTMLVLTWFLLIAAASQAASALIQSRVLIQSNEINLLAIETKRKCAESLLTVSQSSLENEIFRKWCDKF